MSGWDVMAEPLMTVARLALVLLVLLRLRGAMRAAKRRSRSAVVDLNGRRRAVSDTSIVAAYNDALLAGWPAGETATFLEVATRVSTSADHVRTVIARHWAA